MPRWIAALTLLVVANASPAALDPDADTPYQWRIVLDAPPHPLLPPTLRDQLVRDVKAALQPAVGPLATIAVIDLMATPADKQEPLWTRFAEQGWSALEPPSLTPGATKEQQKEYTKRKDEYQKQLTTLTGVKTHFLRVSVRDGAYRLEARQLDGSTGLLSPLVRSRDTAAFATVGRLAGLMLARDFGPVATVDQFDVKTGTAKVRFQASRLGGIERFVAVGDVLKVAAIVEAYRPAPRFGSKPTAPEPPPSRTSQSREFTYLRVMESLPDGSHGCKVLTMYANPMPYNRSVAGYRGLKLATVDGPLQVRVVKPGSGEPVVAGQLLKVRATDTDFDGRGDPRDALDLRDGVFRAPRPMRNLACVVIAVGSMKEVRFPVPVLGNGVAVPLPFEANEADAARAAYERTCEDFRGRTAEARLALGALFDGIGAFIKKGENQKALDRAVAGLDANKALEKELAKELNRLKEEAGSKDPLPAALLASSENQLEAMRVRWPVIEDTIGKLKDEVKNSTDPARFEKEFRARSLAERIKQRLEQGEVEEALTDFDELIKVTNQDEFKKQRDQVAAEWEPKNEEQKKARQFVYSEFRRIATTEDFKAARAPLEAAFAVLLKEDDKHALRGLLTSLEASYTRLKETADLLNPNSANDAATLKDIQEVGAALRAIESKAREHLKKLDPPKAAPPVPAPAP